MWWKGQKHCSLSAWFPALEKRLEQNGPLPGKNDYDFPLVEYPPKNGYAGLCRTAKLPFLYLLAVEKGHLA